MDTTTGETVPVSGVTFFSLGRKKIGIPAGFGKTG
jgi:hypothetical protein